MIRRLFVFTLHVRGQRAPIVLAYDHVPRAVDVVAGLERTLAGSSLPPGVAAFVVASACITDGFLAAKFRALEACDLPWPSVEQQVGPDASVSLQLVELVTNGQKDPGRT